MSLVDTGDRTGGPFDGWKSVHRTVYRELVSGEVSQRWTANGAISAVLVRDLVEEGAKRCANHCILTRAVMGALLWALFVGQKGNSS